MEPLIQRAVLDVTAWKQDELFGNYPEGARSKNAIFPPTDLASDLIIPGRRYLFKRSVRRYPDQFWAEVIAYLVGCDLNVVVPPAFAAYDADSDSCGALIEWFYIDGEASLISGGNYMQMLDPTYDRKRGAQHNFTYVRAFGQMFGQKGFSDDNWQLYWAKAFVFDALIGNTDRHQDNWGYLRKHDGEKVKYQLAPLFDNGTSLGHERFVDRVSNWTDVELERYVNNGRHHMKWDVKDERSCGHFDMIRRIVQRFPSVRDDLRVMIDKFEIGALQQKLLSLQLLQMPVPLTKERADFCLRLLSLRKQKIVDVLL